MTLLEKAKSASKKSGVKKYSEEEKVELALAWLKGDVSFTDVGKAIGSKTNTVYCTLSTGIRLAYKKGVIKL